MLLNSSTVIASDGAVISAVPVSSFVTVIDALISPYSVFLMSAVNEKSAFSALHHCLKQMLLN